MREPTVRESPREPVKIEPSRARGIRPRDLLVRFAFGALTSAVAAGISIAFDARAGGLFLAFPAILAATVTLVEDQEGAADAREDARGAIVGSIALATFAAVGAALFAVLPGGIVLTLVTICWVVVALGVYFAVWRPSRG